MKRTWRFTVLALLVVLVFVPACAKKSILKEEAASEVSKAAVKPAPAAKAPEKGAVSDDEAARKRAAREEASKAQTEKEAKKKATEKKAAKEGPAVPAKELYELTDIRYDFDKFNLQDEARAILDKHAAWLNKNKDVKVIVEGHCDERGTAEYNLALGERRAMAAAKYLTDMGIDAKRITTISYGFERPLDPQHNEAAWAKNRRAHFVASGQK